MAPLTLARSEGRWRRRRTFAIRTAVALLVVTGFVGAAHAASTLSLPSSPATMWATVVSFLRSSLARLNELLAPGSQRDLLEFLFATALFVPTVRLVKTSPIIGFLLMGVVLGPAGLNLFHNMHVIHELAEFGIVFFLFEMGLELSIEKVFAMRKDVFVLGMAQYVLTGLAVAFLARRWDPMLSAGTLVVLGGALALSSSAFVLQLVRDKGQLGTRYGRASFGVLLFQDLAVVPLLVVVPLLAGGAAVGLQAALGTAAARGGLALGLIFFLGKVLLDPLFRFVLKAHSPEAFLAITLGVVTLCSAITEGLGLSNTLGAFLSGVMLSETKYRHQVEADIAPFRGILLGLFFTTVGFSIDFRLILSSWKVIGPLVLSLLGVKAAVVFLSCTLARLPAPATIQTSLLLAPGGEFAFVVLGLAQQLKLLSAGTTQMLVTATALSMALTPMLASLGEAIATSARTQIGFRSYEGKDAEGTQIVEQASTGASPFVVVVGYGLIGQTVCQLLDQESAYDYIAFDNNPEKAIKARSLGLPVFLADCTQPEIMEKFKVGAARLVVIAIGRKEDSNAVAEAISRHLPQTKMLVRAVDDEHEQFLLKQFGLDSVVPTIPPDSPLISLTFGGEVLRCLGYAQQEVESLLEETRRQAYRAGFLSEPPKGERCLDDVFKRYDADASGEIDAKELGEMLKDLGKDVSEEEVTEMLKSVDKDDSGTISADEFKQLVLSIPSKE